MSHPTQQSNHSKPKISIIIPSAPYRSPDEVLLNLKKIKPNHLEFEVFVIKGTWPPLQRNLGIKLATGQYIFFFDDDIIIPAGSIEKALETFEKNPQVKVVGGPNLTPHNNSFLQHCFGQVHASHFIGLETAVRYYKAPNLNIVNENHLITCNLAFKSEVLKENPFNPDLYANEENELLGRILRKGNLLAYNKDFFIYHHRRKNLKAFLKQIFKWGEGRTLHTIKKPKHLKLTFFIPLVFLFYILSLAFIRNTIYIFPLFLYLLLDFYFSLQVAYKEKKIHYMSIMPWLFLATHLSYGIGLFWGFITNFKKDHHHHNLTEKDFEVIKIEMT